MGVCEVIFLSNAFPLPCGLNTVGGGGAWHKSRVLAILRVAFTDTAAAQYRKANKKQKTYRYPTDPSLVLMVFSCHYQRWKITYFFIF